MKSLLKTVLLLLLLVPSAQRAQAQPKMLTLDDAVQLALKNNRQLEISRLEMEKADARVTEAYGTALPNISAAGQYSRALKKPVFFIPDPQNPSSGRIVPLEIGADNSIQFGFTATQILFNSAVFTGVGTAKIYQQASRELYRGSYNQTVSNTKRAFYAAVFMRNVFLMSQAGLKNAEDNLKTVQMMNTQGLVSDYDFIRAQVQVDNIRPSVVEAERNVALMTNNLKLVMGMSPGEDIAVTGELEFDPVDPALLERAEESAIAENANLRALDLQKRVSDAIVSITRSEWYPTLAAFGNYQWQAQKNSFRFGGEDFVRSSQVGLSLSINLFNGMQSVARLNQAQIDYQKLDEQDKMAHDGLRTNVQNIRFRLAEASRRIQSQSKTVEMAERGYKIATTRYSAGNGTQLEVNDADLALLRARVNRIQAVFDYNVARADLEETLSLVTPQ
ncbi:MAG: TolC family protein [Ignavibacteria bacterium]|nr:TolC family protein [Ignavibacteria bacterium]